MSDDKVIVVGYFLILQSCGGNNGAGFGRVESPMWHSTASAEVKRSYFRSQCLDFGFTDKTPEMAQCLQTQMNTSRAAARQRMQNYNANRMRTTTCNSFGNTITCNNW